MPILLMRIKSFVIPLLLNSMKGSGQARTVPLPLNRRMLYQLSYRAKFLTYIKNKWFRVGSGHRHLGLQPNALPSELRNLILFTHLAGFEPAVSRFVAGRSIH